MESEKNFENRIKSFLKNEGAWFIKYWSGGVPTKEGVKKFTKDGVPDILCCFEGLFMGIEVKAPKGKPSKLQLYNLRKIDEAGGFGILLYPKDFRKFKKFCHLLKEDYIVEADNLYHELKGVWSDDE